MSAHTKGPWMALPDNPKADYYWRVSDGENFVCQMFSKHCEFDNAKANARLIAAAPRLLEELQRLVNIADSGLFRDRAELSIATHPAYDDARELIKSIIGETK